MLLIFFREEKEKIIKELKSLEKDDQKINIILELSSKAKNLLSYFSKKNTDGNYFKKEKKEEIENYLLSLIDNKWIEKKFYEITPNFTVIEEIKYYQNPEIIKYQWLNNEGKETEILEEKKRGEVKECEIILRYNDTEINLKEFLNLKNWKFVHIDFFQSFYPRKEIHYRDPSNIFKIFALFHEIGHSLDWEKNGERYYNALKKNLQKIFELKTKAYTSKEISEEEFSRLLKKLEEEDELIAAENERNANEEIKNFVKRMIEGNYLPRELFSEAFLNKMIEVQLYNKKPIDKIEDEIYYSPYLNKKIQKEN